MPTEPTFGPSSPLEPATRLTVGLLTRPGSVSELRDGSPASAIFGDLPLVDVTPFVVLRAQQTEDSLVVERATVVRAALINDPEGRLDEVIARQDAIVDQLEVYQTKLESLRLDLRPPVEAEDS